MKVSSTLGLPTAFRKEHFPNTCQANPNIPILKENPGTHCGPVVITNLIVHLAKTQHQMLIEPMESLNEEEALNRLTEKLASHEYMNTGSMTDENPGTTPQDLIDGLEKYVVDRGYKIPFKSWNGWGAAEVENPSPPPEPHLFAEGVYGNRNAIVHLGWYITSEDDMAYRKGGHFVNSVGYGNLGNNLDFNVTVHDPSPRSNAEPKLCILRRTNRAALINNMKLLPLVDDYIQLDGVDVNRSRSADAAIVDGMLVVEISN